MAGISRMTTAQLNQRLTDSNEGDEIEEIYDELDRRAHDAESFDWTEQDARAAQEDRFQLFMNEY